MVKSILIDDDVHLVVVQKQTEILVETKKHVSMSVLGGIAILAGIDAATADEIEDYEDRINR